MAQETGEIKAHIKAEGESLKDNFEEIQSRVKDALDWKVWYRNNTAIALGGMAAGGLLVSLLVPKTPSIESKFRESRFSFMDDDMAGAEVEHPNGKTHLSSGRTSRSSSRFNQVVDNTMAAVFGVAAEKFQDFMSKALPGFREHYSEAERNRSL